MIPIELRVEYRGIPHLAKNERDAPNFLHAALDKAACAPFFKERRIKFIEATEPHRKSGVWGTRSSLPVQEAGHLIFQVATRVVCSG
jgi:hypothetical protein